MQGKAVIYCRFCTRGAFCLVRARPVVILLDGLLAVLVVSLSLQITLVLTVDCVVAALRPLCRKRSTT